MFGKRSSVFLLIFILRLVIQSYCVALNFNKNHSTITLFTPSHESLVLEIDYKSSDIHLAKSFKNQLDYLYFSKHNKNKLILNHHETNTKEQHNQKLPKLLFYDFQQKQVEFSDGKVVKISGTIGLNPQNNVFLQLIRSSVHKQLARLDYNTQKQSLQVVYQSCHNTIKFPISTKLFYEEKQKTVMIREISQKILIDKSTVDFLFTQKADSIITIPIDEMQSKQVQININGHSKYIPLIQFVRPYCHKKTHTHNYTCDFRHIDKANSQMSGLLLYFDFSICSDGIQIHTKNFQQQETYYVLHCILLFFIAIACGLYSQDQFVVKRIKKLLNKRRYY